MQSRLFEPILNIVIETMPRDNLLNSACLEFFEFIRTQHMKTLIRHLVENYRDRIKEITYVETFSNFILRYDQTQGFDPKMDAAFPDAEAETPKRPETGRGNRWETGIKDLDAAEEEYFNTSDDEEESLGKSPSTRASKNAASPRSEALVDYPSDEENEDMETDSTTGDNVEAKTPESSASVQTDNEVVVTPKSSSPPMPPERLSEKRRREEDEEDELGKLSHSKRRNSSSSVGSTTSSVLRRKKSFTNQSRGSTGSGGKPSKIAISLSSAIKTGGESPGGGQGSD